MRTVTATNPNLKLSREEVIKRLYAHPQFPDGGRLVDIDQKNGQWVAKFEVPETSKQAAPPFPPKDEAESGPPSDEGPPSEPTDEAPSEDGPPKAEKPGGDEGEKPEKPSVEDILGELAPLVHQIAEAVGVSGDAGAGPGDGPLGPHGGPPKPPGPPAGPPGAGPHGAKPPTQRPLRPGDAPPGATPVGAPAFASTLHPMVGKSREVVVRSGPTEDTIKQASEELNELYREAGYEVKRMVDDQDGDGNRILRAKLAKV